MGMGTSTIQAGIIIAFIVTVILIILVAMASHGQKIEITAPITVLLSILFFVFMGWFPTMLGTIIAVIMALFVGKILVGGG